MMKELWWPSMCVIWCKTNVSQPVPLLNNNTWYYRDETPKANPKYLLDGKENQVHVLMATDGPHGDLCD